MVSDRESEIREVRSAIAGLPSPESLFSGLRLADAFAPDNIIFFKRTHTQALAPEGVSNNFHHRFELVVVLEKGGSIFVGQSSHNLVPGEGALIFPNQFHHYLDVEKGEMEWLFITFECNGADALASLKDRPRVFDAQSLALLKCIAQVYSQARATGEETLILSHDLGQLLRHMCQLPAIAAERLNIHSTDDARDVLLERINAYVRANLSRKITLADLAAELGYSESHMRTVFRDRLGVSLGRYIRESQLSVAARLLQTTGLNVTEIARRTSFNSLFAFSRAFKAAYGMSPKAYSRMVGRKVG